MQAKNEISEELKSLSTVIDAISRNMPYGLPAGYFEDLPGLVIKRAREGVAGNTGESGLMVPGMPADRVLPAPFEVPRGYFEGLAGGIMARIKAGQSGDADRSVDPFADEVHKELSEGVAAELARLSSVLSGIDRTTPYRLPEGYFNELAPILAGLQGKPLYEVPEGYFDGLAEEIAAKVKRPAPARVVTMGSKRGWWKYSAAAVVAGLVLTIGWLRLHMSPSPGINVAKSVNVADGLVKLSDQDLQNYLDTDNVPLAEAVTNSTATLDMDDTDVNSLLVDVPDGELKQYMEEHGGLKDNATN